MHEKNASGSQNGGIQTHLRPLEWSFMIISSILFSL